MIENGMLVAKAISNFTISLNLSARMLDQGDVFVRQVTDMITKHGVRPAQVQFEILEKTRTINAKRAGTIEILMSHGIRIALDDYGEGHSKTLLQQMKSHRIPIHSMKIGSSITATAGNGDQKLQDCLVEGYEAGIRHFVPEGSKDHPVTERQLDGLRQKQEEWSDIDMELEGPVRKA